MIQRTQQWLWTKINQERALVIGVLGSVLYTISDALSGTITWQSAKTAIIPALMGLIIRVFVTSEGVTPGLVKAKAPTAPAALAPVPHAIDTIDTTALSAASAAMLNSVPPAVEALFSAASAAATPAAPAAPAADPAAPTGGTNG